MIKDEKESLSHLKSSLDEDSITDETREESDRIADWAKKEEVTLAERKVKDLKSFKTSQGFLEHIAKGLPTLDVEDVEEEPDSSERYPELEKVLGIMGFT